MGRKSPFARMSVAALLAVMVVMQSLAAACDVDTPSTRRDGAPPCGEIVPGMPHCPVQHDPSCPESLGAIDASASEASSGAWPQWHAPACPGPVFYVRVDTRAVNSPAPSLAGLVPEVRNLSIALLNLRQ